MRAFLFITLKTRAYAREKWLLSQQAGAAHKAQRGPVGPVLLKKGDYASVTARSRAGATKMPQKRTELVSESDDKERKGETALSIAAQKGRPFLWSADVCVS